MMNVQVQETKTKTYTLTLDEAGAEALLGLINIVQFADERYDEAGWTIWDLLSSAGVKPHYFTAEVRDNGSVLLTEAPDVA